MKTNSPPQPELTILNFSHDLSGHDLERIEALTGRKVGERFQPKFEMDHEQSYEPQVKQLVDKLLFTTLDWRRKAFVINPPVSNHVSMLLMAEITGRLGHMPMRIIRHALKPEATRFTTGGRPFQVVELYSLETQRTQAHMRKMQRIVEEGAKAKKRGDDTTPWVAELDEATKDELATWSYSRRDEGKIGTSPGKLETRIEKFRSRVQELKAQNTQMESTDAFAIATIEEAVAKVEELYQPA